MHTHGMIRAASLGIGLAAALGGAALAGEYNLSVDRVTIDTAAFTRSGVGFNGASPGPVLRFKEGEDVTIHVKNNLDEWTSVHWHGMILPFRQDGVPGLTFAGIAPGETFTYRFPITQAGTYWFHSHSGFQEPDGAYGAIVIEPKGREPFRYDRDYVVQFTDAHPHQGSRIFRNLKTMPDYYNRQQRTLVDLVSDVREEGLGAALADRFAWGGMRMMPTDIEDVQGTTPLINGEGPEENWTGLFEPGERVRLRFINSSAMTYFDVRIPGLEMTVVQADGQNVQPVTVDELRIAVAETYDVIVRPTEDRAYTIFAETMGRSAYARGTLAPRPGMEGEVPEIRDPRLLTMADMGMDHGSMGGMDHGSMPGMHAASGSGMPMAGGSMTGMDHGRMAQSGGSGGTSHTMPDGTAMDGAAHGSMSAGAGSGAHMMPDGTAMPGMQHGSGGGSHTMPDGTTMPGMQNGTGGAGHTMPDGTTMPGMQHGSGGGAHTMPDGTTMPGGNHPVPDGSTKQGLDSWSTLGGSHTMPDGSTMQGMDHGSMPGGSHMMPGGSTMQGMDHGTMGDGSHTMPDGSSMPGMDHGSMSSGDPFYAPGSGLTPVAAKPGGKVLGYADLKALKPLYPDREPTREIEIRLTGNMERYIWSIDGVKFEDADPIMLRYGERVRFKFVNETMMSHPMHLHGMWSILDNGNGRWNPAKHTISIAPGTTVYTETEVDAEGVWAFHCHLAYHMDAGMMRKVVVEGGPSGFTAADAPDFGSAHNMTGHGA